MEHNGGTAVTPQREAMPVEIYSTETDCDLVSVIRKNADGGYELADRIGVGRAPRGSVKFTADSRGLRLQLRGRHDLRDRPGQAPGDGTHPGRAGAAGGRPRPR